MHHFLKHVFYQFYIITYHQIPGKYSTCSLDTINLMYSVPLGRRTSTLFQQHWISLVCDDGRHWLNLTRSRMFEETSLIGFVWEGFSTSGEFKCPLAVAALFHRLEPQTEQKEMSLMPVFIVLCFLVVDAMWANVSCTCCHDFPNMDYTLQTVNKTNPSFHKSLLLQQKEKQSHSVINLPT